MLRQARIDAGITGVDLASRAAMSQSRVSKIENGKYGIPSRRDLELLVQALGLDDAQALTIFRQHELAQLDPGSYMEIAAAGVGAKQAQILDLERSARLVRVYQSSVIPGLLQTPSYTRALLCALGHEEPAVAIALDQRSLRQATLRQASIKFVFVIDEAVLYGPAIPGITDTLVAEQLAVLRGLSAWPNIEIRTLASAAPHPIDSGNPFMIVDRRYVSAETTVRELTTTTELEIRAYERAFDNLYVSAAPGLPEWSATFSGS